MTQQCCGQHYHMYNPTIKPVPSTPSVLGMSSRPVNALTLDEIHARENIHTTPAEDLTSKPSSDDLGAFNKLVAGLQSSGALHNEVSKAEQYQVLSVHGTHLRTYMYSTIVCLHSKG